MTLLTRVLLMQTGAGVTPPHAQLHTSEHVHYEVTEVTMRLPHGAHREGWERALDTSTQNSRKRRGLCNIKVTCDARGRKNMQHSKIKVDT